MFCRQFGCSNVLFDNFLEYILSFNRLFNLELLDAQGIT